MDKYSMLRAISEFEALLKKYPNHHFIGNCDIKLPVKQFLKNKNNIIYSMNRIEIKKYKNTKKL